jgi:acyl dehydratase
MEKEIRYDDLTVGSEMPILVKAPVDKMQLVKYSGASGDFNPLHTDPEVGKAVGIGQIAHGMLIMGFVGQAITDWVPKKFLKKLSVRFAGMTRPGDVVTVNGNV